MVLKDVVAMVNLQSEVGALDLRSRMKYRHKLMFDSNRVLKFEKRSVRDLANREYDFEAFRRLYYEITIEGGERRLEQAKQLNIQGVGLYKEGKLKEAKWCFEKALSFNPGYENARKNLSTISKKLSKMKKWKRSEAKKGRSFRDISEEQSQTVKADTSYEAGYQQTGYQDQSSYQHQAQYDRSRSAQSGPQWKHNYRCPGCGIPVRDNWVMCTNCGVDLRRYPPVQY